MNAKNKLMRQHEHTMYGMFQLPLLARISEVFQYLSLRLCYVTSYRLESASMLVIFLISLSHSLLFNSLMSVIIS
jgi:hypothetical protein